MYLTRKQSINIAIAIIVLFFITAFLIGSIKSTNNSQAIETAENLNTDKKQEESAQTGFKLREFHRTETKDGKKVWEIKAESGIYKEKDDTTEIFNPRLWFYKEDGKIITLSSKRALVKMVNAQIDNVELYNSVVMNIGEETTVKTKKATYNKNEELVTSKEKVYISTDVIETTGIGLEAYLKEKKYKLLRQVKSLINPKNNKSQKKDVQ